MKKNLYLLLILASLISCSMKKSSIGPNNVIYVCASKTSMDSLKTAIDTTFSYGIRCPAFQAYYTVEWCPIEKIATYAKFKNLVILADLNKKGIGWDVAKSILRGGEFHHAENDSLFLFSSKDYWVTNQQILLVAGKNFTKMRQNILEQQAWIFQKYNKRYDADIFENLYRNREEKQLTKLLWHKYDWTIRMPNDYVILQERPKFKFVWMGTSFPYRWISVSWAKGIKTEWLTANGLFEMRNQLSVFYEDIKTDERFLGHKYTRFGEWEDALHMTGIWYHETDIKGGPFSTWAFYDKETNRTFVVDLLIFNPGKKLTFFMKQMEVMAKTFTTDFPKDYFD